MKTPKIKITDEAGNPVAKYQRRKTGKTIPCPGEAHSNPFIDNCGVCAPGWETIDELAPIDFDEARRLGHVIGFPGMTETDVATANAMVKAGTAKEIYVREETRAGSSSYYALAWI